MTEQKSNKICRDFLNNKCYRDKCKFMHPEKILKRNETIQQKVTHSLPKVTHLNLIPKETITQPLEPRVTGRNTVCWNPLSSDEDMRVMVDCGEKLSVKWNPRDVLIVPNIFKEYKQYELYNLLVSEISKAQEIIKDGEELLKLWHGNKYIKGTHVIADDSIDWKQHVPTFTFIVNKLADWFGMRVESTRFNWYRNDTEWKPFHHDRAAIESKIALKQNVTVGVSFGQTRGCAFEHAKNKTVINFPQSDGSVYAFFDTTNVIWRHGVLPNRKHENDKDNNMGRISIILWGWI